MSVQKQLIFILFLFLFTAITIFSCTSNAVEEDCNYGTPTAVFADIDSFEMHAFDATGQNSKEFVRVPALAMDIELFQSGCNSLTQEFRFILHGTLPPNIPADACAIEVASIFYSLGQLDPKLFNFQQFAEAIKSNSGNFRYNENTSIQGSNIKIKILKQNLPKSTILTVIFSS